MLYIFKFHVRPRFVGLNLARQMSNASLDIESSLWRRGRACPASSLNTRDLCLQAVRISLFLKHRTPHCKFTTHPHTHTPTDTLNPFHVLSHCSRSIFFPCTHCTTPRHGTRRSEEVAHRSRELCGTACVIVDEPRLNHTLRIL